LRTFEGGRFVRGMGSYVCDIRLPNTAYLKILRSPYPRALIKKIEIEGKNPYS